MSSNSNAPKPWSDKAASHLPDEATWCVECGLDFRDGELVTEESPSNLKFHHVECPDS